MHLICIKKGYVLIEECGKTIYLVFSVNKANIDVDSTILCKIKLVLSDLNRQWRHSKHKKSIRLFHAEIWNYNFDAVLLMHCQLTCYFISVFNIVTNSLINSLLYNIFCKMENSISRTFVSVKHHMCLFLLNIYLNLLDTLHS